MTLASDSSFALALSPFVSADELRRRAITRSYMPVQSVCLSFRVSEVRYAYFQSLSRVCTVPFNSLHADISATANQSKAKTVSCRYAGFFSVIVASVIGQLQVSLRHLRRFELTVMLIAFTGFCALLTDPLRPHLHKL